MIRKPIVQTPHTCNGQVLNKSKSIHKAKLIEINELLCKIKVIIEIWTQEEARGWAPAEKNVTFNTCYLYWITGRSEEKNPSYNLKVLLCNASEFHLSGNKVTCHPRLLWSKAINYWQTKGQHSAAEQTIIYSRSYLLSCLAFLFLTCALERRNWLCEIFF